MRPSNENRGTANYARSSKPKKAKLSEQVGRGGADKESDNEGEIKRHEVKKCKTCGGKHKGDCWQLKTKCFIYHNLGHIAAKRLEKSSSRPFSSHNTQAKKQLCYS